MAYKKRTFRRKTYGRRKTQYRVGGRYSGPVGMPRPPFARLRSGAHNFKRSRIDDISFPWISPPGINYAKSLVFSLNQIPGFGEFQALFDRYKLNAVKCEWFLPVTMTYSGGGSATPRIHTVIDYDDNTDLPNISAACEYESYKLLTFGPNTRCSRYFKPRLARQIYNSALSTAYEVTRPVWLDLTDDQVPHFGLKCYVERGLDPVLTTVTPPMTFKTTYYFQCRDVR